ncbi:hypothetical protein [Pontiella sulfatireligans]|uniref:EF-hand domain-containing protein n=1 Tax=Pontiella sulfatireligans TaxID=2750658 RepID=A0A6C2USD7_9BACT|nr:hypothetical protein [Pontiella sulfatireligans]VGO21836.1 hypothetical protein SCARR_03913 [Pontiella sulfatireligans]
MKKWMMIAVLAGVSASVQAAPEGQPAKKTPVAKDMTKEQFVAMEKAKWAEKGWRWNQVKVESNFDEMDVNKDGLASGKERKDWFAKKKAEKAAEKAQ